MGENNWMASEGLDFDMKVLGLPSSKTITVQWGELAGSFVSYSSKKNQLVFETADTSKLFTRLGNGPKEAKIIFEEEVYTIAWSAYNYVVSNIGDKITILVEEKQA